MNSVCLARAHRRQRIIFARCIRPEDIFALAVADQKSADRRRYRDCGAEADAYHRLLEGRDGAEALAVRSNHIRADNRRPAVTVAAALEWVCKIGDQLWRAQPIAML